MKLKKLWRRKSVDITEYDPTYKVIYLGNIVTGWAKGEGCVEKPLATLWRNYCQSSRPDISMKVTICGAGLRAVTREHGLTEYWAHRITHCSSHPAYPKVFCWIYRHEGRRLKQELRCHAVLCPKQGKAEKMSGELRERLAAALHEFRREKAIRQNARLSVVNAALYADHDVRDSAGYPAPFPLRKFYLVTGAANYRPPLERSKSAPKLGAIEETEEEEEEEEEEEDDRGRRNEGEEGAALGFPLTVDRRSAGAEEEEYDDEDAEVELRLEGLLSRLGDSPLASSTEVALVYERVEEVARGIDEEGLSALDRDVVTFSTPTLVYCPPKTPLLPQPPPPPDDDDLRLLEESFKAKLGAPPRGGEESLTSDQPESLGSSASHSCSSSCDGGEEGGGVGCDGEGGGRGRGVLLLGEDGKEVVVKKVLLDEEDEDNISEESGYSEDKECITLKI